VTEARRLAGALEALVSEYLPALRAVADGPDTARPNRPSGKEWSQREELGHLLDSAVNNHGRFARAALQESYEGPGYEQEGWVRVNGYAGAPWTALVEEWAVRNAALARLVANIPDAKFGTPCVVDGDQAGPLRDLVASYILHARHHLDQVLRRPVVTPYPSP
jgi:hypothetical protein